MSIPIPNARPQASLSQILFAAAQQWEKCHPGERLPEFFVLAVRGYYSQTFAPAGNNVGIYDDAVFVVSPLGFSAWNFNSDPLRYGWNPNAGKFMARLMPGCWKFRRVMHRGKYWAYGQSSNPVTVERIGKDRKVMQTETGLFGINLHRGGINGTSSEGCSTLPVPQWEGFDRSLKRALDAHGGGNFDYILIDGPIN